MKSPRIRWKLPAIPLTISFATPFATPFAIPFTIAFAVTFVIAAGLASAALAADAGRGGAAAAPPADLPRVLLVPQRETTIVAQMVGTVARLGGSLGAPLRAGAELVRFQCAEPQARLAMYRAELTSAEEQYAAKQRLRSLSAAGEVEVALARAAVEKARAQVGLGQAQVGPCVIAAPFPGRIARLHVREHQGVNIGQPLVDLVSDGPLEVRLNAPSRWLAWLRRGTPFTIEIDETGRSYPAVLTAINARVDPASQSVEIEGRVEGRFAELLAGMSGNARFDPAGH